MVNSNTFESFKQIAPEQIINSLAKFLIESITSGSAIREPWRLTLFLIFSYSDLKKYKFYYWVAHPTPYNFPEIYYQRNPTPICDEFSSSQIEKLQAEFLQLNSKSKCFFAVLSSIQNRSLEVISLAEGIKSVQNLKPDCETVSFINYCRVDLLDTY